MNKPKYTHLLLDADNTLFDFDKAEKAALDLLAADFGYTNTPELVRSFHDCNLVWWRRLERGEADFEQLTVGRFIDFINNAGFSYSPELMCSSYCAHLAQCCFMLPDAEAVIRRLSQICELYIITNGLAQVQHGRFDFSPISPYIRRIFISQEVGFQKPHPAYFDYVLKELGSVDKRNILVVGDSLTSDIAGGAGVGIDTCWYSPNGAIAADIMPTYTISHLSELEGIVLDEKDEKNN